MPPKPDLTEFRKLSQRQNKKPCVVDSALESLNGAQQRSFQAACGDSLTSNQGLALWLEKYAKEKWVGNWQHALAHRSRKCSCTR